MLTAWLDFSLTLLVSFGLVAAMTLARRKSLMALLLLAAIACVASVAIAFAFHEKNCWACIHLYGSGDSLTSLTIWQPIAATVIAAGAAIPFGSRRWRWAWLCMTVIFCHLALAIRLGAPEGVGPG